MSTARAILQKRYAANRNMKILHATTENGITLIVVRNKLSGEIIILQDYHTGDVEEIILERDTVTTLVKILEPYA